MPAHSFFPLWLCGAGDSTQRSSIELPSPLPTWCAPLTGLKGSAPEQKATAGQYFLLGHCPMPLPWLLAVQSQGVP